MALGAVVFVLAALVLWGVSEGVDQWRLNNDTRYKIGEQTELLVPENGVTTAGGLVQYSRDFACNEGVDIRVDRALELAGTGFRQDFGWVEFDAGTPAQVGVVDENGCVSPSVQTIRLPGSLLPGVWRIRFDASWDSYGDRKTVRSYSPWFEVR